MLQLILRNLQARRERAALVVAGAALIAAAFALFASASSEMTVSADQALSRYWRTTYDILVRPPAAVTGVERQYGLVEANHLGGTPGGITFEQYERIREIPGVEVAAPIAMLGYLPRQPLMIGIRDPLPDGVYAVSASTTIWDGYRTLTTTLPGPYYTFYHQRMDQISPWDEQSNRAFGEELLRLQLLDSGTADWTGFRVRMPFFNDKALLVAVDPEQEARLVHLDQMVVDKDYLPAETPPLLDRRGYPILPVLLNVHDYVSMTTHIRIEQVDVFEGQPRLTDGLRAIAGPGQIRAAPHRLVWEQTLPIRREWRSPHPVLNVRDGHMEDVGSSGVEVAGYIYAPAPVQYRPLPDPPATLPQGSLVLEAVPLGLTAAEERLENADVLFSEGFNELLRVLNYTRLPELVFRQLSPQPPQRLIFEAYVQGLIEVDVLAALGGASPNQVPLETYFPPLVTLKYDDAGRPVEPPVTLRPTLNNEGYLVAPPDMLTTLDAARYLLSAGCTEWLSIEEPPYFRIEHTACAPARDDIISAIRVRVGGISALTPQAQVRVEEVAQRIVELTGLHVDIMVGSSPQPVLVHIPGYGETPGLGYVEEMWVKKGVDTLVSRGMNRADGLLFGVMLVACLLYLFNANYVSVLGRLREFGVMRALGWRQRTLFGLLLGETLLLGLFSGALGALVALGIVAAFGLAVPLARIALLIPLGGGGFLLGALLPAWRAARVSPIAVIRAGETASARRLPSGGSMLGYAASGTLRRPARTLATLSGLTLAAGLLVLLKLVLDGLGGTLYGTLLGRWVRTQVQPYHLTMGAVALLAAALGVAQLMLLNVNERRREIGLLVALGWRRGDLFRVFLVESALIGLLGGLLGTALACLLYGLAYGSLPGATTTWLHVSGLGLGLPLLIAPLATLYPAHRGARLLPLQALRGEERLASLGALNRALVWLGVGGAGGVALIVVLSWVLGGRPAPPAPPVAGVPTPAATATAAPAPPPAPTPTPVAVAELPRYRLALQVDAAGRRLEGQENITFSNKSAQALETLALRLYRNRPVRVPEGIMQEIQLQLGDVRVNGRAVTATLVASETAALLPLQPPLRPGEQASVDLTFELQVPRSATRAAEVWSLRSFFPLLAIYEQGDWWLDVCAFCEDIAYSESGVYEFTLTAPADWVAAATGERVDTTQHADGSSTHLYRTGPVRDLALALSPDFRVQSQEVDGVKVSVYALPDDAQAEAILQTASQALQLFNARFGPYPYASLDLLALAGPGSAGLGYPGWIHLGHPQDAGVIPALVSREVAHQWWYGVVGNDVLEEPWLDEALAEYSVVLYLEAVEGAEAAQRQLQGYKDQLQRLRALEGFDQPVGSSVWAFAPRGEHLSDIVQGKGALFMDALRQEIGAEAFLAGWRTYYERYRFGVATGRGFLEAMQQAAGQDLRPFFEEWVGPFPESE